MVDSMIFGRVRLQAILHQPTTSDLNSVDDQPSDQGDLNTCTFWNDSYGAGSPLNSGAGQRASSA